MSEWQRDWAWEETATGLAATLIYHGGATDTALAWEFQLLATRARAGA